VSSALFSPIALRGVEFPNRIVVAPMCQYAADRGLANDWHLMHLGQFAVGGAGLLFTEASAVSPAGRITHKCLGLYDDTCEAALARPLDFCRATGTARLGIQLAHAGRKASAHPPDAGARPLGPDEDPWVPVAPSAVAYDTGWPVPEALDNAGLAEVTAEFVEATERAARLGLEVCELHAGHGYLLHQFLSPLSNRRDDAYGGTADKRQRFPLEVFAAVRAAWPKDRPLGIRVSGTDWIEGGWTIEDTVRFGQALKDLGCDFIDITSGGIDPGQKIPLGPGYQVPLAARVKAETGLPTMAVGMITEPAQAEAIVAEAQADFVMLARGMMYDPRWAWHAAEALGVDIDYAAGYVRCHPSRWPQAFPGRRGAA